MTTFTATGDWTASQGNVAGVITFTPSIGGAPVPAIIAGGTFSVAVPVISGSYLVTFNSVTLNGASGTIAPFSFVSPSGAVTVSVNTLAGPPPLVFLTGGSAAPVTVLGANGIPGTKLTADVQNLLAEAGTAYQKPSSGIPVSDLSAAVQAGLGSAGTSYQKPSSGIPETDLVSAAQTSLSRADAAYGIEKSVSLFGATGNGTTDDTAAIHAARDAAGVGGRVVFPAGTYIVSGLTASVANQQWVLLTGATIKAKTGATKNLYITGAGVSIRGGVFDGANQTTNDGSMLGIHIAASGVTIERVKVQNAPFYGIAAYSVSQITIDSCTIVNSNSSGIWVQNNLAATSNIYDFIITNNIIDNSSGGQHASGIGLYGPSATQRINRVQVSNNTIVLPYNQTDLSTGCIGPYNCTEVVVSGNMCIGGTISISVPNLIHGTITGNTVRGFAQIGIELPFSTGGHLDHITVSGNTIDPDGAGGFSGIQTSGGNISNLTIIGNAIKNFLVSANLINFGSGTVLNEASVIGNTLASTVASGQFTGICFNGPSTNNVSIVGNVIDGGSTAGSYGILFYRSASGVAISGNQFSDLAVAALALAASSGSYTVDYVKQSSNNYVNCAASYSNLTSGGAVVGSNVYPETLPVISTGIYYAKDYGVVADGVTNNTSALNALITTVTTAGGGVIELPTGTMVVNSSITMKSNVTLRGRSWGSVIKLGANIAGRGIIEIGTVSSVLIENLKIDGNRSSFASANWGIYGVTSGYSDILIRNVWVASTGYTGIGFLGDSTRTVVSQGIKIVGCKLTDIGGSGVLTQAGVDKVLVEDCTLIGHAVLVSDAPGIVVGRYSYDVSVLGNFVDSTGSTGSSPHGISLDTVYGRATCSDNTVTNGVGFGIEVGFVVNGTVTGNTITAPLRGGIKITSIGAAADNANQANLGVSIAGNTIDGAGTTASGIGFFMGSTATSQDIPAVGTIARSTAYTAATGTRVYEARRLYECTTSGTTSSSKPASWGTTALGATITDGTAVWTDRGSTNSQISISGNVIRNIAGVGIDVNRAHDVSITDNVVTGCTLSGINAASNANIYVITDNTLQGNNFTATAGYSNISISAYSGINHVAKVNNNRILNGGVADMVVVDSGSSLRIDDRFLANSTAPDVAFGNVFLTQNSSATTIISLKNPNSIEGRVISVRVADANTTFQHNSSGSNTMRLLGGVNFAAPTGTYISFMWNNQQSCWAEVSRSQGIPFSALESNSGAALTVGSISGSAAKLTTARTINGVSFDGSANIITGDVDTLTGGAQTVPRWSAIGNVTTSTGAMVLGYFIADQGFTAANVTVCTNATAAAATPTLCRIGLYSVDGSGNLTLIGSTANDVTLFAAAFTVYTKALSATVPVTAGSLYALGILTVSAAACPSFYGAVGNGALMASSPRRCGFAASQADLPATFSQASVGNGGGIPYVKVTT